MRKLSALLADIETQMPSYEPPTHLLIKMNDTMLNGPLFLQYVMEGGEAGGYFRWLALLVRYIKPKNILELGNREGVSTIMLYSELPQNSNLISVDIVHDQRFVPDIMWKDTRVSFVFGDCLDIHSYRGQLPEHVDLLFTDTVHTYQQLLDEFYIYENLLADDALIVIDDIHLNDKGKFFEDAPYEKYDLTALCHVSGFGLIHYVRKEQIADHERRFKAAMASAAIWKRQADYLLALISKINNANANSISPIRKFIRRFRPLYRPIRVLLKPVKNK